MNARDLSTTASVIRVLLDKPIAYHRIFATVAGGATAGLMLSQMYYWSNGRCGEEGWFWKTASEWEKETGLTRHEQESVRRKLLKEGLINEQNKGCPPKMHFRINFDVFYEKLITAADPRICRKAGINLPESGNQFAEKRESYKEAETTTETTYREKPCASEESPESELLTLTSPAPQEPSLHVRITRLMMNLYENRLGKKPQWTKVEGKLLKQMLENNRGVTAEVWESCIRNLYKSDYRFVSILPRAYLSGRLLEFQHGPKDKYGSLIETPPTVSEPARRSASDELLAQGIRRL